MKPASKAISAAAAALGRIGGSSGRGAAKARSHSQARKAALARWANARNRKSSTRNA